MLKLLGKNKKGFTLVELIVVLVILAILAAILIPSLTGYVDKANERTVMAEARSALLACQTLASESYAESGTVAVDTDEAVALAEVPGTIAVTFDGAVVDTMTYTNTTTNDVAYYDASATPRWEINPTTP